MWRGKGTLGTVEDGPLVDTPLERRRLPPASRALSRYCQSIRVLSLIHRWYLLAYLICCQVSRLWSISLFVFCLLWEIILCGGFLFWQAAVGFADAMFEQWAWRKIIWNTATWRASPSGSISPKTRWVSQCCMFVANAKGAVTFFVCAHVSRASKWRLSRWTSKREHELRFVASFYHW